MKKVLLMTKTIDTLVEDIYKVVKEGTTVSEDLAFKFGSKMAQLIKMKLSPRAARTPRLSMSSIGKPDRQAWYEVKGYPKEEMQPHTYLKFIIGDLWEALLMTLAEAAGHKVEGVQDKLTLEGVNGYRDGKIDGVTIDVKSASTYSFQKFKDGSLRSNDPFGYMHQLAGYHQADPSESKAKQAGFLAGDKQNGHIYLMKLQESELPDATARIKHLNKLIESDTPPEKCYEPLPSGKSGNMKLAIGCSYCAFKNECWKDANDGKGLRSFTYSYGVEHLVKVVKEPKVWELK